MFIRQVIILEDVEGKLWRKHRVADFEVHEVFANRPHIVFREIEKDNLQLMEEPNC